MWRTLRMARRTTPGVSPKMSLWSGFRALGGIGLASPVPTAVPAGCQAFGLTRGVSHPTEGCAARAETPEVNRPQAREDR
jgi:hypothetical protein